jgi:hypothetical protein
MIVLAILGIALAQFVSFLEVLDTPFLGPDPRGVATSAPIKYALLSLLHASAITGLVLLWTRLRG